MITYSEIKTYTNTIRTPPFISSSYDYIQLYNKLCKSQTRSNVEIYTILSYAVHRNYTPLL